MKWQAQGLQAVAILGLVGSLVTGCSDSVAEDRSGRPTASASPSNEPVSTAEKVKLALETRISADEQGFGSGTHSPCSTSAPQMFTAKCKAAAEAASSAAGLALSEINGREGFATLRSVAQKLQAAVRTYEKLGCATGPTAPDTRHACLGPAAVIAQGFDDLRDGANLALAASGK